MLGLILLVVYSAVLGLLIVLTAVVLSWAFGAI
jgi:hypothetical protein